DWSSDVCSSDLGTPTAITPTFTVGSISNFQPGARISVAGMQTCFATAARVSSSSGQPNTTLTVTSCTDSSGNSEALRIPVQKTVTVTGCSDSSFNDTGLTVNGQNWPTSISVYTPGS